jgi:hypothetical protein
VIAELEAEYAELVGNERFEMAAQTLDKLLVDLSARASSRDGDFE